MRQIPLVGRLDAGVVQRVDGGLVQGLVGRVVHDALLHQAAEDDAALVHAQGNVLQLRQLFAPRHHALREALQHLVAPAYQLRHVLHILLPAHDAAQIGRREEVARPHDHHVRAHPHLRAEAHGDALLVIRDGTVVVRVLVGEVLHRDDGIHAAQGMALKRARAVFLLHLLEDGDARPHAVAVVGRRYLHHLGLQAHPLYAPHHGAYQHVVVDAAHGLAVGIVLNVGPGQVLQAQLLRLVLTEIQFLFHGLE